MSSCPLYTGSERDKTAIKQTLFDCGDTFLRTASPFMPYLTEELYQRLHICNEQRSESICVARYPTPEEAYSKSFTLRICCFLLSMRLIEKNTEINFKALCQKVWCWFTLSTQNIFTVKLECPRNQRLCFE
jgi:valyl-tRNA synthetase